MSTYLKAHVKNGKFILDEPLLLSDDTEVIITVQETMPMYGSSQKENIVSILKELAKANSFHDTDPITW